MKGFLIVFPDLDIEVKANLLLEQAPKTCEGFLEAIKDNPIKTSGKHAMYTGREISVQLPLDDEPDNLLSNPAPENLTCFPTPGDLLFTYMPKHAFGGIPVPIFDVGIFYGRDARTFFPMGWLPGNRFATISHDDLDKIAEVGSHIHLNGQQNIIFKKIK